MKNKGAWQRANKWLKMIQGTAGADVGSRLMGLEHFPWWFEYINRMNSNANMQSSVNTFDSVDILAVHIAQTGIPWQIWRGHLTHAHYVKGVHPVTGKVKWTSADQQNCALLGREIRGLFAQMMMDARQALDAANLLPAKAGNPGGVADDNSDT